MTDRFILEREFTAGPEELFNAWIDVRMLRRWFGCGNDQLWNVHEWDVRKGGSIYVSLDFGGKPYEIRGEFLIVDPSRRLRYRWEADETVTSRSNREATARCCGWSIVGGQPKKLDR